MSTAPGLKVIKTMLIKTLNIKVSFQWTFEDSQRWAATDRVRQTVPGARCCDGEGAVAHCCTSRRRHDEIGRWRGYKRERRYGERGRKGSGREIPPPKSSWVEWTLQTVVYPVVGVYPFSEIWMPKNGHLEALISLSSNRSISIRDTQNICWSIQHYVPFHVGAECDSEPAVAQVL